MAAPNIVAVATITGKTTYTSLTTTSVTSVLSNAASSGKVLKVNNVIVANTDGTNPFGSSIYVNRCNTSTVSSNTYTIPLISADGMTLNATYTNIYVIVRYKGDPTPITSITTTFS